MKHTERAVIGGVDTHADTHQAAVLDERGRLLGVTESATSLSGYQQLLGLATRPRPRAGRRRGRLRLLRRPD
jgi:hypothetical protein